LPFDAELSSISCARRASVSGRRSATTRVDVAAAQAQDLRRIQVLRHLDGADLRHAHALGVGTPHRQRADTVSDPEPCAARAQLLDDTDKLIAGVDGGFGTPR
jgi:hypothetical protein